MMTNGLLEIVNRYRKEGINISDEDADNIKNFCIRKMEIANVQNPNEYLPLLYEDEIKNFIIRSAINAEMLIRIGGGNNDVLCMQTNTM